MNITQTLLMKAKNHVEPEAYVHADRVDGADRTLLFGYDCDRNTHHVYLRDGHIHLVRYTGGYPGRQANVIEHHSWKKAPVTLLVPNKRLYPESCDYDFADHVDDLFRSVKGYGISVSPYDEQRAERVKDLVFHGHVVD